MKSAYNGKQNLLAQDNDIDPSIPSSRAGTSPLNQYLAVLNRQAWLILLVTGVTVAIAAALTFSKSPVYRASMKMFVSQSTTPGTPGEFGSTELMQTMTNLLHSQVVADRVISDLNLRTTPSKFSKRLHSSFTPGSSVLDITFDSGNKRSAAIVLGRVGTVYDELVRDKLGEQSSSTVPQDNPLPVVDVTEFDPPHTASTPISPKPVRTMAFAGVLGLAFGIALAFLREGLDERIRNRSDAEHWLGAPVIATLPRRLRGGRRATVVEARDANPALVASVEVLRANLLYAQPPELGRSLLVTSPMPAEGKSFVAANLAYALALSGEDVICVDADLRRPSLHRYFGLERSTGGVSEVFTGRLEADEALREIRLIEAVARNPLDGRAAAGQAATTVRVGSSEGRLRVLTAGAMSGTSRDPATTVSGERVQDLIDQMHQEADFVIFDGPPLFVAEVFPLAIKSDRVLVVARQGRTTREKARSAQSTLSGLGVAHVSVVLTDAAAIDDYRYR
jgi:capsular polysaccharide biosynthesis protein/MinD-like ATPase involved in chromosome partitioning or flagellar assembly